MFESNFLPKIMDEWTDIRNTDLLPEIFKSNNYIDIYLPDDSPVIPLPTTGQLINLDLVVSSPEMPPLVEILPVTDPINSSYYDWSQLLDDKDEVLVMEDIDMDTTSTNTAEDADSTAPIAQASLTIGFPANNVLEANYPQMSNMSEIGQQMGQLAINSPSSQEPMVFNDQVQIMHSPIPSSTSPTNLMANNNTQQLVMMRHNEGQQRAYTLPLLIYEEPREERARHRRPQLPYGRNGASSTLPAFSTLSPNYNPSAPTVAHHLGQFETSSIGPINSTDTIGSIQAFIASPDYNRIESNSIYFNNHSIPAFISEPNLNKPPTQNQPGHSCCPAKLVGAKKKKKELEDSLYLAECNNQHLQIKYKLLLQEIAKQLSLHCQNPRYKAEIIQYERKSLFYTILRDLSNQNPNLLYDLQRRMFS